jgi:NADH:ubiquinone oxidoreductase subunit 5 (subunit L)/multisubunit Na+/H+ antiporter MnhA subunit
MNINWDIYYDILSVHMLLTLSVLSVVSFAVHCYSMVYMRNDQSHVVKRGIFKSFYKLFIFIYFFHGCISKC